MRVDRGRVERNEWKKGGGGKKEKKKKEREIHSTRSPNRERNRLSDLTRCSPPSSYIPTCTERHPLLSIEFENRSIHYYEFVLPLLSMEHSPSAVLNRAPWNEQVSLSSISLVKILQNSFLRRSCSGIHPFGTHSRHSIVLKERGVMIFYLWRW